MSNLINTCLKEISSNFNLLQMKKREYTKKGTKNNNKSILMIEMKNYLNKIQESVSTYIYIIILIQSSSF